MTKLFQPLRAGEQPVLGLFFLERPDLLNNAHEANVSGDPPLAAGIAFLIDGSGLLATASHVPLICGSARGQRATVFCSVADACIEVKADVLEEGWLGPLTCDGLPMSSIWNGVIDERPDVFRWDLCFLRILPATARWLDHGAAPPPDVTAEEALTGSARVLPLGLSTRQSKGKLLTCWVVAWEHGGPACHPSSGTLDDVGPALYDALRFKSDAIGHGFSGSPVWHEERRVVVGIHRRGVNALPGSLIATDTRAALRAQPHLTVAPDWRLGGLLARPLTDASAGAPQRHPEFINWYNPRCLVEQEISQVPDLLHGEARPESVRQPALSTLVAMMAEVPSRQIILQGPPGSGKSTLLRRLAAELAEQALAGSALPLVPVLLSARDLVSNDLNLRRVLNEQLSRATPVGSAEVDVLSCIEESGSRLVLLIDALDEVSKGACVRILGAVLNDGERGARSKDLQFGLIHHVVITTRQTDETRRPLGPDRPGLLRFDLHLLGQSESRELALALLGSMDEAQQSALDIGLQDLRLASKGATPLQVWMAAFIIRHNGRLPRRPLDLVHEFVALVTAGVLEHLSRRLGARISGRVRNVYVPKLPAILGFIANASVGSENATLTESELLERFRQLGTKGDVPSWLDDPEDLVAFVFEMLPAAVGVLGVSQHREDCAQLTWLHATFVDYLAACHTLEATPPTIPARAALLSDRLRLSDHWPALHVLNEMERRKEFDAVAAVVDQCLSASATTGRPHLFVLRALAVGIDGGGLSRKQQVKALVRSFVLNYREPGSCESLFRGDDLPDAEDILARPDLKEDIREALEERFAMRLRLAQRGRPFRMLDKEVKLIESASLWYEMEVLGVRKPPPMHQTSEIWQSRSRPGREGHLTEHKHHDVAGMTRLFVQDAEGRVTTLDVPSMEFADTLVHAARAHPAIASTSSLVAIASHLLIGPAREPA